MASVAAGQPVPGHARGLAVELIREQLLREIEGHLASAVEVARQAGLDAKTLHSLLDISLEEGTEND